MKADSSRSADDGRSKTDSETLVKPLFPSRIPKKPKKQSGRSNPLKRPFTAMLGVKETDGGVHPTVKVATLPATLPLEKKLSFEATELVNLIPTLSGVDVSRLVASIKRRRLQRTKASQARTTQRLPECTLPPTTTKPAPARCPLLPRRWKLAELTRKRSS